MKPGTNRLRRPGLAGALLLLGLALAGPLRTAAAGAPAPLRFGFSSAIFAGVNEGDAHAAIKIWARTLGADCGIEVDSSLLLLDGTAGLKEALQSRKIDGASMSALEYWELRRFVPFSPSVLLGVTNGETTQRYLLLVRRDNPASNLVGLRGQTLAILGNPSATLGQTWIETLLLEKKLGRSGTFWRKAERHDKLSQVILPVFFRKVDACVVTRAGFQTMRELNPQVGKQLKVLAESGPLVSATLCFRGDTTSPYLGKLLADIARVASTPAGRQTLAIFQSDGIVACPASDLDGACALLDRHQELLQAEEAAAPGAPPAAASADGKDGNP